MSLSVAVMGNMSERRKIRGSFMLDGQIRGSVNNHIMFRLFTWRQLPSSTMPVICPTVNQALKQAPLLSCPTCGARSSLYALWCGIIWDGEGGEQKKINRFEPLLSSRSPLCRSGQCVCVHAGGMFSVIVHCIRSGWPSDKAPFFFVCVCYNERLK